MRSRTNLYIMKLIRQKKNGAYSLYKTNAHHYMIISETNSCPIIFYKDGTWSQDVPVAWNLPEYVREWLDKIGDRVVECERKINILVSALNGDEFSEAQKLFSYIQEHGTHDQVNRATKIMQVV